MVIDLSHKRIEELFFREVKRITIKQESDVSAWLSRVGKTNIKEE